MKLAKLIGLGFAALFVFFFALSCENPVTQSETEVLDPGSLAGKEALSISPMPNVFMDIGQVKYINLEGGFWGIVGSKGNYEPVNLPRAFMVDGLVVIFQAEYLDDMASIHMWGRIIRIIKIEKLTGKIISDVGVVKQVGIQGRPFIIEGTKGTYQPVNLPEKYQVSGLKVKFTARLRPDVVIIPALWPVIEIISISAVSEPVYFKLGEKFQLPVTQAASGENGAIVLVFESVLSDSRCPRDVVCVWEGEAVISVNILIGGTNYGSYKLSTRSGANSIIVSKFSFTLLDLSPLPVSTSVISPLGYTGTFVVDYVPFIDLPIIIDGDVPPPKK